MAKKKEFDKLRNSHKLFHQESFSEFSEYPDLAKGQSPKAIVIACSDSRVDPAIITKAKLGELFVVRNVANLVPSFEQAKKGYSSVAASLQYAVNVLKVKHVIVQGHSHCGGINALVNSNDSEEISFVNDWIRLANPAKEEVFEKHSNESEEKKLTLCEEASIKLSLENLITYPFVKKAVQSEDVELHGWYFDLDSGKLLEYSSEEDTFKPLVDEVFDDEVEKVEETIYSGNKTESKFMVEDQQYRNKCGANTKKSDFTVKF